MKFETGQTSSNKSEQHATTHNMVCKRSQHVGPNIVASCWPTMLRAFARAFRLFFQLYLNTCARAILFCARALFINLIDLCL